MSTQFRVHWTDSRRRNKKFKGDWVTKEALQNWKSNNPKIVEGRSKFITITQIEERRV